MGKRYCFFSAQYLPHMGGVENYTYNIAQELIKRGNEVVVVTNNTTNSCQHEYMGQIEVLRIPCFNFLNGRFPVMRLNTQFRKIDHYLKMKRTPQECPNGVRLTLFINQYFREYQNYNFYTAFTLLIQRLLPLSLPVLLLFPHL